MHVALRDRNGSKRVIDVPWQSNVLYEDKFLSNLTKVQHYKFAQNIHINFVGEYKCDHQPSKGC